MREPLSDLKLLDGNMGEIVVHLKQIKSMRVTRDSEYLRTQAMMS